MTRRPERERPAPPSRQELGAARDELFGVVRAAMAAELERVMPRPRPPSRPTRTLPAETVPHHDAPRGLRGRCRATASSSIPPRGSTQFRSRPGTRRPSRRRQRCRPSARRRRTGDMSRASDPTTRAAHGHRPPVGESFEQAGGERAPRGPPFRPPGIRPIGGHRRGSALCAPRTAETNERERLGRANPVAASRSPRRFSSRAASRLGRAA